MQYTSTTVSGSDNLTAAFSLLVVVFKGVYQPLAWSLFSGLGCDGNLLSYPVSSHSTLVAICINNYGCVCSPFVKPFVPANVRPETTYRLQLTENYHLEKRKPEPSQSKGEQEKTRKEEKSGDGPIGGCPCYQTSLGLSLILCEEMLRFDCDRVDLVCLLLSFVFGVWYIVKKVSLSFSLFCLK